MSMSSSFSSSSSLNLVLLRHRRLYGVCTRKRRSRTRTGVQHSLKVAPETITTPAMSNGKGETRVSFVMVVVRLYGIRGVGCSKRHAVCTRGVVSAVMGVGSVVLVAGEGGLPLGWLCWLCCGADDLSPMAATVRLSCGSSRRGRAHAQCSNNQRPATRRHTSCRSRVAPAGDVGPQLRRGERRHVRRVARRNGDAVRAEEALGAVHAFGESSLSPRLPGALR
ncbi:hypothetical protein MRB53_037198 [Persea americana]|nr:hypothetical protein MRB53_037198 [Persea americana]